MWLRDNQRTTDRAAMRYIMKKKRRTLDVTIRKIEMESTLGVRYNYIAVLYVIIVHPKQPARSVLKPRELPCRTQHCTTEMHTQHLDMDSNQVAPIELPCKMFFFPQWRDSGRRKICKVSFRWNSLIAFKYQVSLVWLLTAVKEQVLPPSREPRETRIFISLLMLDIMASHLRRDRSHRSNLGAFLASRLRFMTCPSRA